MSETYKLTIEDRWILIESMVKELGLVRQHLDSYNEFIQNGMQDVVKEIGSIKPEIPNYYVKINKIDMDPPNIREADGSLNNIYPSEARIRNLTYTAPLYLDMTPIRVDEAGNEIPRETSRVFIGRMPIMLKSKVCPLSRMTDEELIKAGEDPNDPGGYFIINGSERVLVTQEDLAPNRILIEKKTGSVTSMAKVFSTAQGVRAPVTLERSRDGSLNVSFPSVPRKIPFAVLLKALGLESDKAIVDAVTDNPEVRKELIPSLDEASEITDEEKALDFIGKRVAVGQTMDYRIKRAREILNRYLLRHIGTDEEDRIGKAYFLGQMAQRVLELELDKRQEDDKDHYSNKRLKLSGESLISLFRVAFMSLCRDIKYQLERTAVRGRTPNIRTAVRADVITERLRHALATGNWVGGKAGVSQLLDRTNYISTLSHLRRVVSPLSRNQPHFEARDLHPTHFGKICPSETPEGPNCGLVKNLAMDAYISVGTDEKSVEDFLNTLGLNELKNMKSTDACKVFLNGRLLGSHPDPYGFVSDIRKARRKDILSSEVNVNFYDGIQEIQINCDHGRVRRPLLIAEKGKQKLDQKHAEKIRTGAWTWSDLIRRGIVEYLDAEEEESSYIAMEPDDLEKDQNYTHLEIAPSSILGICASLIPFAEHNQSPRNTYESAMAKQALGMYAANHRLRVDTRSHILFYPQKPLVKTHGMDIINFDKRPAGQNMVIALLSYEGYNMEDAIIFNKHSIQRGLARSAFFRRYEAEERRYPAGQEDKFERISKDVRGFRPPEAYVHLSSDGIVEPESKINGDEVIIGRTSPPRFLEEYSEFEVRAPIRHETSISMRHSEEGFVDTIILTETSDGNRLVKVKMRDMRIPELGDKFASRHGQKGVIGLIAPPEDLPFTSEGIIPDIIVNCHAIPSRMTIGQILETMASILGSKKGTVIDATPFEGISSDSLVKGLKQLGLNYYGKQAMYNGITGRKYDVDIFMGIAYYQKLHHLVKDKTHARSRGPVQILTRQPTEGRAREGGLRFGEMERDCLVGHGAALLLKERLLEESDKTSINVCGNCGVIATYDRNKDKYFCPVCKGEAEVSQVVMSYAFKLLLQELISLGMAPRLVLKDQA
ncbi:MAG: DNA-directed RNA polymerase subunit B [Candidatus Heimdallarchaeota archaeon]|nr:DNA-directed RNA polymerase subunit B [Candidatus Heimdallarchaeota archaeon]